MRNLIVVVLIVALATPSYSQKKKGWITLFDGKTFKGWKFFKDRKNTSWEIKDGAFHRTAVVDDTDDRPDLTTVEEFENFELLFDWKISAKGNSGVMFRSSEELAQPYLSGPEYQVKDDIGFPEQPEELKEAGSNYDMQAPINKVLKPVGKWNKGKIIANGKHVEHWLNGKKILEYEIGSEDWLKQKAASKWKNVKDYGMMTKGHIVLQDHGQEVWYRKIKIKLL